MIGGVETYQQYRGGRMRGHLKQRAKGSWTIVLELDRDPTTGKRKQQWVTVRGTKRDAEKKLAELQHQMDTGGYLKPSKITVGDFLIQWLSDHVWSRLELRTAEGYDHMIRRHLVPALGAIPLAQLSGQHLQSYYADKLANGRKDGKGGLSPRTVRHHHVTIHTALQSAVKWGLLLRNPADSVDAPRFQPKEMRTLDEDGVDKFLGAAKQTPYYELFYLALYSGMRRSELLALRWSDLDLYFGELSINRSFHHLRDGSNVFRTPKTPKARRLISLTPSTAIILREHKQAQETQQILMGNVLSEEDLIFCKLDGAPFLPDTVTHVWIKLARRTGLKVRLHDARHTHATLLLKQNVRPKVVQERLGHATIATTFDTYSHVLPGMQEEAALQFDQGIAQARRERGIAQDTRSVSMSG